MIRNVFIDLDDTLFDFKAAERAAMKKALEELSLSSDDETVKRYSEINKELWRALERGEISRSSLKVRRFEILFSELRVQRSPEEAKTIYESHLSNGHIFMPGAPELLEALYGKYRLYLASNGSLSVQVGRIKSSGISKYFEKMFISEAIGYAKPTLQFFEYCFSEIDGFSRNETIIIGDTLSSDILGGINSGIHTCYYNPRGKTNDTGIIPEFEISALSDVEKVLEML